MKTSFILRTALAGIVSCSIARADVRLPAIISDHMVLEKTASAHIWGWADAGEDVTVSLDGKAARTKAGADGKWTTSLNLKDSAPGPFEMTVQGKNKLTLIDVVVGEVWVASGQSNMEFALSGALDAKTEIIQSANPLLRQFLVKKNAASEPQQDTEGKWVAASPETSSGFTAVGYFFAKKLQNDLKTPVGLVYSCWGGTPSESWTSREAIESLPDLKAGCDRILTLIKEYPEKKKAFIDNLGAWIKANGREDKPVADASVYAGEEVSAEGWTPVKIPGVITAQGLPKAGAVWLRKEIVIPADKTGAALSLRLPIDGFESAYWNGKLLKQTTYQDFPGKGYVRASGPYDIPASAVKEGRNVLALRFYEPVTPASIPADPKAGPVSLGGEWLARAEYEFPDLEAQKIAGAPQAPGIPPMVQYGTSYLFNGMIHPILPYAIKGVIWYQGEANASRSVQYRKAFPLLIADWRKQWNQGDFPFYFCQLANFLPKKTEPAESGWAELREAQAMTLKVPNTGQAVLIDVGEAGDIHPRNKKDVGERLALIALARDFGKTIPYSGPVYDSMKVDNGKVILSFKHTDGGLVAKPLPETYVVQSLTNASAPLVRNSPNSQLEGFAICGNDKKWIWADAKIDGGNVIVWSDKVAAPVAVRYAWADNPTCNLYNGAGLPASPFRTDDFPAVTLNGKY